MPTYEYACASCGHTFDEFQSMTDRPLKKCPECGKRKLERIIGAGAGIIFKGSGFYQTDYRSKDYKEKAEKEKEKPKPEGEKKGKGKDKADAAGGGGS